MNERNEVNEWMRYGWSYKNEKKKQNKIKRNKMHSSAKRIDNFNYNACDQMCAAQRRCSINWKKKLILIACVFACLKMAMQENRFYFFYFCFALHRQTKWTNRRLHCVLLCVKTIFYSLFCLTVLCCVIAKGNQKYFAYTHLPFVHYFSSISMHQNPWFSSLPSAIFSRISVSLSFSPFHLQLFQFFFLHFFFLATSACNGMMNEMSFVSHSWTCKKKMLGTFVVMFSSVNCIFS